MSNSNFKKMPVGFVADNMNWEINVREDWNVGARTDDKIIIGS